MRLAIVAMADFDKGGATVQRVQTLARGLAWLSHDVQVVVPQRFRPGPKTQTIDGVTFHWAAETTEAAWNTTRERLRARKETVGTVRRMAKEGLDWLVLYNLGLEAVALIVVAHRHGAKVAAEYCDTRVRPERLGVTELIRFLWLSLADAIVPRRVDFNIAISRYLLASLQQKAPSTPAAIVPPLVDCDRFQPRPDQANQFRERWGITEAPIIAYCGSYWEVEGISTLLKAAQILAAQGERFKLVISGEPVTGLLCDDVARLVREMRLSACTVETGWLSTGDVIAAMSAADILVVPKIDHVANRAGVATKMIEYISMGRPVVATRVGDVEACLQDGEDALLCEPGNARDLADRLRSLLREPSERLRLGCNARRTATGRFDYRVVAAELDASLRLPGTVASTLRRK